MSVKFTLEFSRSACPGCGASDYILAAGCSECGRQSPPGEVNPAVVRRTQGVRAIRRLVDSRAASESQPLPYYRAARAWRSELTDALTGTLAALAQFARHPLSEDLQVRVAAEVWNLRILQAVLGSLVPRRPFVAETNASKVAIEHLLLSVDHYFEAFLAPTPSMAQVHARAAQQEIDSAVDTRAAADASRALLDDLAGRGSSDYLTMAMQVMSVIADGRDPLDFDESVRRDLARVIGSAVLPGLGADYAVSEALAAAFLDPHRFKRVVVSASRLFRDAPDLRTLANENNAISALSRARQSILTATQTFEASMRVASADEVRLRVVLNLYREVFEEAATPLLAWALRAIGLKSRSFAKLMEDGSTELLKAIERSPQVSNLFFGADANIRNAASHGQSYELVEDLLVFRLRSYKGSMTIEVLIDLLLALLESCLATLWALENELGKVGYEGATIPEAMLDNVDISFVQEIVGQIGFEVMLAEDLQGVWRFELSGRDNTHLFQLGAAIAMTPFARNRSIEVAIAGQREAPLEIRRDDLIAYLESLGKDGPALNSAHLTVMSLMSQDSLSVLSGDHIRNASALAGHLLLVDDNRSAIALLRQCRLLASPGDADILSFCSDSLQEWQLSEPARRQRLMGIRAQWSRLPKIELPKANAVRVL